MITSTGNAAVKNVVNLCKKAKERNRQGLFVVEGPKMFAEVPPRKLESVYISESFYRRNTVFLERHAELLDHAKVQVVSDTVCKAMSDTQTPQGIICLVRQMQWEMGQLTDDAQPLVIVLENLQDPGNLGTIVRTAEGAGVTGILLSRGCVDIYNPKVIRSTMGSIYRVPFVYTDDLAGALTALKDQGVVFYAAHLNGSDRYTEKDYTKAAGFMIGNESKGLSDETTGMADHLIRIPMRGQVESLNAAAAAAILMYEAARQRS